MHSYAFAITITTILSLFTTSTLARPQPQFPHAGFFNGTLPSGVSLPPYAPTGMPHGGGGPPVETKTPCDTDTPAPTQWGTGYIYPTGGYAHPTGAPFPPSKPSTMYTLGSTWGPKPTQPSSPVSSSAPAPSASFIANQSSDATSSRTWSGVLVAVAAVMVAAVAV
jgi:hypothetical protein